MMTATFEFVNYAPRPAPTMSDVRPARTRTAEPERGWFAQDSVLSKVSTALVPLRGLFAPPADTVAPPVARQAIVVPARDTRTDAMNGLFSELISYQFLPHDWDGYDGQPAEPQATLDALEFLLHLPRSLPLPSAMLAGSGAVGLYWDRGEHYASLDFEGDGTYTYLTDSPDGYGGAEGIAAGAVPVELRQYLASLPVTG